MTRLAPLPMGAVPEVKDIFEKIQAGPKEKSWKSPR